MILVVDLSYRPGSLSADEFVTPVGRIVRGGGFIPRIRHYTALAREEIAHADGAILCGTALADFGYLGGLKNFAWLASFPRPVLGICAGMQVIARIHGGEVYPGAGIGMMEQRVVAPDPLLPGRDRFAAYELHGLGVIPPATFLTLVVSPSGAQAIRHREKPVYGVMFHPEVRNEWLIRGFLSLCRPSGRSGDGLIGVEGEEGT